jgi:hypothetical protein
VVESRFSSASCSSARETLFMPSTRATGRSSSSPSFAPTARLTGAHETNSEASSRRRCGHSSGDARRSFSGRRRVRRTRTCTDEGRRPPLGALRPQTERQGHLEAPPADAARQSRPRFRAIAGLGVHRLALFAI